MAVIPTAFSTTLPDGRQQFAAHYLFENAGDEITLHTHSYYHSTSCLPGGECEVYDSAGKRVIVKGGHSIEFAAGREHAIRALVAGTQIFSINEPGAL